MSGQDNYYSPPSGPPPGQSQAHQHQSNNPFNQAQPGSTPGPQTQTPPAGYGQYQQDQYQYGQYQQQPAANPSSQQFGAPRRTGTFEETDFVPESERGEQREMMEQFELSKSGGESQEDRDLEQLQREFPGLDGSLIAAIYGDSKDMGATREMLFELAKSQ